MQRQSLYLIADALYAKIGFQAQKQFEKKAISVFDVECRINKALEKNQLLLWEN